MKWRQDIPFYIIAALTAAVVSYWLNARDRERLIRDLADMLQTCDVRVEQQMHLRYRVESQLQLCEKQSYPTEDTP